LGRDSAVENSTYIEGTVNVYLKLKLAVANSKDALGAHIAVDGLK
jgi:hypothetical protein